MKLTGDSFKKLRDALNEAFDENRLRAMLRIELDTDLDVIVAPGPRLTRVEDLIRWAEYNGRLPDLLTAAQTVNPTNQALAAAKLEFADRQPDPCSPSTQSSDDIDLGDLTNVTTPAAGCGATSIVNQDKTQIEPGASTDVQIQQLVQVVDQIKTELNRACITNQEVLAPLFSDSPNLKQIGDTFAKLYHIQTHRADFGEWVAVLDSHKGYSDRLDNEIKKLEYLLNVAKIKLYSRDPVFKGKIDLLDEFQAVRTLPLLRDRASAYLDELRDLTEEIGGAAGRIKVLNRQFTLKNTIRRWLRMTVF